MEQHLPSTSYEKTLGATSYEEPFASHHLPAKDSKQYSTSYLSAMMAAAHHPRGGAVAGLAAAFAGGPVADSAEVAEGLRQNGYETHTHIINNTDPGVL